MVAPAPRHRGRRVVLAHADVFAVSSGMATVHILEQTVAARLVSVPPPMPDGIGAPLTSTAARPRTPTVDSLTLDSPARSDDLRPAETIQTQRGLITYGSTQFDLAPRVSDSLAPLNHPPFVFGDWAEDARPLIGAVTA